MRILHIITRMIIGGAQENTLLSVLGQQEHHDVRLISGPTRGPEGSLVPLFPSLQVDFEECPGLTRSLHPPKDLRAYRQLRAAIRRYQPDVVHTHSSKAGILGRCAAWAERIPCVVHTIHGLPFHPYQPWWLRKGYITAERFAAKRCHRIACVADAMSEKAIAAGVAPPDGFETVYSGMRTESFLTPAVTRQDARARYGIPDGARVLGKIARLFELKGHEELFTAVAPLMQKDPDLRLFLVGDGSWRERLEEKAESLHIRNRITWAGLVPPEEIPACLQAMDALTHCSLREGLARVLPQALLSGIPVISLDIDGAREVVRPQETGWLVPAHDPDALRQAIHECFQDLDHARQLAANGREWCQQRFNWRGMSDHLLNLYQQILATSATQG